MFAIWMHFKGGYWIIELIMEKLIMEKNNYGKTGQSALAPWFYRKNQLWK